MSRAELKNNNKLNLIKIMNFNVNSIITNSVEHSQWEGNGLPAVQEYSHFFFKQRSPACLLIRTILGRELSSLVTSSNASQNVKTALDKMDYI